MRVLDYHEHAIGSGADARAVAYLELRIDDTTSLFGVGIDSDIVSASLKAVLSGVVRAQAAGNGRAGSGASVALNSPDPRRCAQRRIQNSRSFTMADKLIIFDTTLRDGEQSPGASDDQGREAAHRHASSSA